MNPQSLLKGEGISQTLLLGEFHPFLEDRLASWKKMSFLQRLWAKDVTLWAPPPVDEISDRLGWLTLPELMQEKFDDWMHFAEEIKSEGITSVVVLGMGGSSLAPEVFQKTFGNAPGFPELRVLDSTHPEAVIALEKKMELTKTLFLVSSKSGTTIEPLSFFRYFWNRVSGVSDSPGRYFAAITDPGTPLEDMARERKFRRTFTAPSDVGGRYSALSDFGLVPAALIGLDVRLLLERARTAAANHASSVSPEKAAGLVLGAAIGETAKARNKLTIFTSPGLESLPEWLEQLIAESTGKDGTGIIPVTHEELQSADFYRKDRFFVSITLEGDEVRKIDNQMDSLERAGHPVIRIVLDDIYSLGQEMFRWEVATAAAGSALGIHPFNQPDVELAKDLARKAMSGEDETAIKGPRELDSVAIDNPEELGRGLKSWLDSARSGDYISLQAYLPPSVEVSHDLRRLGNDMLQHTKLATTFGFGPRFLHSTGQLHKGGQDEVLVLQIVDEPAVDLEVPETDFTFKTLIQAQSMGDFRALQQRERRVLRINLKNDVLGGMDKLRRLVRT